MDDQFVSLKENKVFRFRQPSNFVTEYLQGLEGHSEKYCCMHHIFLRPLQQLLSFHLAFANRPELLNGIQLRGIRRKVYAAISTSIDFLFNINVLVDRRIIHHNIMSLNCSCLSKTSIVSNTKLK